MIKYNFNSTVYFLFTIILSFWNPFFAQSINIENELKIALDFNNWVGKYDKVRNGINLSSRSLRVLSNVVEIKSAKPFFISQKKDGENFVKYRSQWQETNSDTEFVEITLSFLNSCLEAQEYLIDRFISSTLPFETKVRSKDKTPIAGDISFYNGAYFIRNNILVKIHAEGKMASLLKDIAQEIDALLLEQNTEESYINTKPIITELNDGRQIIIEP